MDSNWQMAEMISRETGMDVENAYHKIAMSNMRPVQNIDNQSSISGKLPVIPVPRLSEESVSAKEFVDTATNLFGVERSAAISAYSRETGRDLEGVFHEANRIVVKPFDGTAKGFGCSADVDRVPFRQEGLCDSSCSMIDSAEWFGTVMKYAWSGNSDERHERRDALSALGRGGCTTELYNIVVQLITSGDSDARETRRTALDMLGIDAVVELQRIVSDYATSGDSDARETRRRALQKLGEYRYTEGLTRIVEELITSGDGDARETRRTAVDFLGPDAADWLCRIVMQYSKSGDSDARETRRKALQKLREFGCVYELRRIAEDLADSGDSDAQETRRLALDGM